jgi:hypothetical protein
VLLPEQTATVDVQLNTDPAAAATLGQEPFVVAVPFTKIATLPAGIAWPPVLLIVTDVPAPFSIRAVWACWLSWAWSCVSVLAVAVWATRWNQTNAKPTMDMVISKSKIIAITGVIPFI